MKNLITKKPLSSNPKQIVHGWIRFKRKHTHTQRHNITCMVRILLLFLGFSLSSLLPCLCQPGPRRLSCGGLKPPIMPLLWQAAHQATIQFVAALRLYSCSQARASFQSGEKVKQSEGESHGGVDGGWRRGSDADAKRFSIALLLKAVKPTCRVETNEAPALPHCLSFRSLLSLHTLDKADSPLPLIPAAVIVINVSHKCSAVTCSGEMDHYLRAPCPSTQC